MWRSLPMMILWITTILVGITQVEAIPTQPHPSRHPIVASRIATEQPPAQDPHIQPASHSVIPILYIACDRADVVQQTLPAVLQLREAATTTPVFVSQGCVDARTTAVIRRYSDQLTFWQAPPRRPNERPYDAIARHYGWALRRLFQRPEAFQHVILLEDDLVPAPDLIAYFRHFSPLLHADPSLMCISAWNDHGKAELARDPTAFFRSDFFPGLGWMLTRATWLEWAPVWPRSEWDTALRHPGYRRGRACIFPEVARVANVGTRGASAGLHHDAHVAKVVPNAAPVDYNRINVTRYRKDVYDPAFEQAVYAEAGPLRDLRDVDRVFAALPASPPTEPLPAYRLTYHSLEEYARFGKALRLLNDVWDGVPRMAYNGVVSLNIQGRMRLYLAPPRPTSNHSTSERHPPT